MMRNNTLLYLFSIFFLQQIYGQDIIKPNIIIFYTDDLGWQDTQLNNEGDTALAETPNMLTLAAAGANFSQGYSPAPTCAPSRTAMMSGHHTTQTKMTHVSGGQIPEVNSNNNANKMIAPFYPGRLNLEEITIAEALTPNGYVTGAVGKWHMAVKNNAFPAAIDQGFDYQFTERGMHQGMADRSTGYATDAVDDPYRIDADGRPFDSVTESALDFLEDENNKVNPKPFFLYMATWLVHAPIQSRDLALLTYYCDKLGIPVPTTEADITTGGQTNPYFGAMVATADWSLGKVVDYLETTDDNRNPGKKLIETTYIIFSSDNGAAENVGQDIVTDNFPLGGGKKHLQEGGVRTPFVIRGPGIAAGGDFTNVVSHLDFFPTILSITGTTVDASISDKFDGVDLAPFLKGDSGIIEDTDGNERTDLYWHFPHGPDNTMQSSLRSNEYKLYNNHLDDSYELYQLYNPDGSNNDIEEAINIINVVPEATKNELIAKLDAFLAINNAKYPQWNADYSGGDGPLLNQNLVPTVVSTNFNQDALTATATVTEDAGQAEITSAYLIYRISEVDTEEWFLSEVTPTINGNVITADVPADATSVILNLIDENNFLVLTDNISTVPVTQITLNVTEEEQQFEPESTDVYAELLGSATAGNAFIQMRTEGGGDGFNINVKATESVLCEKIVFRIRSLNGDTANFDVTIGGVTQSFEYTSTNDTDDLYYEFNTPVTITEAAQTMDLLVTGLTNSNVSTIPRFRVYAVTYHLDLSTLGVDDVKDNSQDLNLFPNPVKDILSLSKEVKSGVLYNLNGAKSHEFSNKHSDIDISHLQSGIYILNVMYKDGSKKYMKLLKE